MLKMNQGQTYCRDGLGGEGRIYFGGRVFKISWRLQNFFVVGGNYFWDVAWQKYFGGWDGPIFGGEWVGKHFGKWGDKIFRGKVANKFGAVVANLSGD